MFVTVDTGKEKTPLVKGMVDGKHGIEAFSAVCETAWGLSWLYMDHNSPLEADIFPRKQFVIICKSICFLLLNLVTV